MKDEQVIDVVNKYYNERECMKCAMWDAAAKEHGKRGMCGECFDMHYVSPEMNIAKREEEFAKYYVGALPLNETGFGYE
jgi:hypothetical protein